MSTFDPQAYGPTCAALLSEDQLCELGPGTANQAVDSLLSSLDTDGLFPGRSVVDQEMAACCISALWLLHGFLERSHSISQDIHTPSGSYWHGIMHRREPDYSNAKYWFRRVGRHAVFDRLRDAAHHLAATTGTNEYLEFLAEQTTWDPFAFVDLCEMSIQGKSPTRQLCELVAQAEWRILFDYCYREAVGD